MEAIEDKERRDHVEAIRAEKEAESVKPIKPDANVRSSSVNNVNNRPSNSVTRTRSIEVTATAYTAFCDTGCTGVTATGVDVSNTITHEGKRVIATDPNVIPLGTDVTLRLPSGKTIEAVAEDTGGAINGNKIDVLVGSKDEAINFGRQSVEVEIH